MHMFRLQIATVGVLVVLGLTLNACYSRYDDLEGAGLGKTKPNHFTTGIFGGDDVVDSDDLSDSVVGLKIFKKKFLSPDEKYNSGSNLSGSPALIEIETCSGALIKKNIVLTAAHCVRDSNASIEVIQGVSFLDDQSTVQKRAIKKITIHPKFEERRIELLEKSKWSNGNPFDIAVLELDSPLEGAIFSLAEMSLSESAHHNGGQIMVAGFGFESLNLLSQTKSGSQILRTAILPRNSILEKNFNMGTVHSNSIESFIEVNQKQGVGVCVGDSGGPLFYKGDSGELTLFGVASSVRNPGHAEVCKGTSRFVEVKLVRDWILSAFATTE